MTCEVVVLPEAARLDGYGGSPAHGDGLTYYQQFGSRTLLNVLLRITRVRSVYPPTLLCLSAFSFFLRLHRLDAQSLRGDEILGIIAIKGSFADMFASEALLDHPPLYFIILRFWLAIAGDNDFAVRFPSVAFGTLTTLVVFHIARRLLDSRVGLLAAAIAAISPLSVVYGQEARAYGLSLLLATTSVCLVLVVIERGDRRSWLLWACVSLLAVFSEYMAGLVVAFEEIFLIFFLLRRRSFLWRHWALAQAIIFGPFLPWLYISQAALNVYVYDSAAWGINLGDMLRELAIRFSVGHSLSGDIGLGFASAFVGLAGLGLLHRRRDLRSLLFSMAYLFVPIAMTYAVSLGILGFAARHLLVAIPAFFLLVACGLIWLRRRSQLVFIGGIAVVVVGSGLSLANYYYEPVYAREDLRGVARYLEEEARPGDLVVFTAPWGERMFRHYSDYPVDTIGLPISDKDDPSATAAKLAEAVVGRERVWLVHYLPRAADPEGTVENWLTGHTYPLGGVGFNGVAVYSFLGSSPLLVVPPAVQHVVDKTFEGRMRLVGYDVDDDELPTKDRLRVTLYWQSVRTIDKSYRVQVRLVDGQRQVWASRDNRPVRDTFPTDQWAQGSHVRDEYELEMLSGAPPGEYGVSVRVYDPDTAQPLSVARGIGYLLVGKVGVMRRLLPPPPDRYAVPVRAQQDFGEIELLGYGVWARGGEQGKRLRVAAGDKLTVSTLWRAKVSPRSDVTLSLQLKGQGRSFGSADRPIGDSYASGRWQIGEVMRDFRTLVVDPELPAGSYQLLAVVGGRERLTLSRVDVTDTRREFAPGDGVQPVGSSFQSGIELIGYTMTPADKAPIRPGSRVALTLFWKTTQKMATNYSVFTHLVDAQERIVGQHDSEPGQGSRPTAGWLPREVVADRHDLVVAADAGPGKYRLFVGLYDHVTGQRLLLTTGQDRLPVSEVRVGGVQ